MAANFYWEIMQDRRQWSGIFDVQNGEKIGSRIQSLKNNFKKQTWSKGIIKYIKDERIHQQQTYGSTINVKRNPLDKNNNNNSR